MKDYGIREKATGEIIKTFDDPIEAKASLPDTENYEVCWREPVNIYELKDDGRTYIVGTKFVWHEYFI